MPQLLPQSETFKRQLSNSLAQETKNTKSIKFVKNANIYNCGDKNDYVYYVVSGQVKHLMISQTGKECIISIFTQGDIFGETWLSGIGVRQETATTMDETVIKRISCSGFLRRLTDDCLIEGFIKYLSLRISHQQDIISQLIMEDSEHRLGRTLLNLARKLGKQNLCNTKINHRLTHEELSEMVGTTRPRITKFMNKFQKLNLIETTSCRCLVVKEEKLSAYLEQVF